MARVLICEPHGDVRELLDLVVRRLGHEPVNVEREPAPADGPSADVFDVAAAVIEPGEADGLRIARRLHEQGVPVLFTSIFPPDADVLALGPVAYLVKPFPLQTLEKALAETLSAAALRAVAV